MPTCSFPTPIASACVNARNRVVEPAFGRPTMPTCTAIGAKPRHWLPQQRGLVARLLDLLLQRDERAVLKRLHGAVGLAEDRRDFAVPEVEHELERQHLALLRRKLVDQLE